MKSFGHDWLIGNPDMGVSMSTKKIYVRPGQPVPISGQYHIPGGKEVTLVKGKPAPPTKKADQKFALVDKTKHKG